MLAGTLAIGALIAFPDRFANGEDEHQQHVTASPIASPGASTSPVAIDAPRAIVHIDRFAFAPRAIEIAAGTRVVWSNDDGAAHTVTADDGSFDSGQLTFSEKFGHTFTTPGAYTYYCAFHANMPGKVTVIY
jgi:plastocyanin